MKLLKQLKGKWLRNIGYALSLTTIAFIFQACYGPRRDYGNDILIEGKITDIEGKPIEGVKVSNDGTFQYERSDSNGTFRMYTPIMDEYKIKIEDDRENSIYADKDTIIPSSDISSNININLQLK